jgi:hypothetical protein
VVVRCLQNMALLIMTKLYNGLWVFQANHLPKDKTKKKKKKDEEQDNPADVQDNNVLT